MNERERLDPIYESDRITGSTAPEGGAAGSNVVGRPLTDPKDAAFHEPAEAQADDRTAFDEHEALEGGGSFDGLGVPVAE